MLPMAATKSTAHLAAFEPYICAPCLLKRTAPIRSARQPLIRSLASYRYYSVPATFQAACRAKPRRPLSEHTRCAPASTLASSTAINAPSTVPPAFRELHQSLQELGEVAKGYVDISRIQLALRSLESDEPTKRISLVGLGATGATAACKLARVLLSDPLSEQQDWERELIGSAQDGRTILLRFGDHQDMVQSTALLRTMHIPSPYLQQHNVEILVTRLNSNGQMTRRMTRTELEQAVLVPPIPTPTSADGRVVFVRYPVHKAVIVSEGIQGAVEYGRLPEDLADGNLIHSAVSVPLRASSVPVSPEESVSVPSVDIDLAMHALDIFRASSSNGAQYGQEWETSRVDAVAQWIAGSKATDKNRLDPAVSTFLASTMNITTETVSDAAASQDQAEQISIISNEKREEIEKAIREWSAGAHQDLQLSLNSALDSKAWKRTAWFRLLWRVDDVSASTGDILRLMWLNEAELTLANLSGRITEAGLATTTELKESAPVLATVEAEAQVAQAAIEAQQERLTGAAELSQSPTMMSRIHEQSALHRPFDPPWPHTIALNRQRLLASAVPSMHHKAQTLLLSTISTIAGTSALAAWLWTATAGSMLAEAGAIAALGLVWSLRRLQRSWGREREHFTVTLREDGRRALAEIESHLKRIAKNGGKAADVRRGADEANGLKDAQVAVERCQQALQQLS